MSHQHIEPDTVQKQSCDYDCTACNSYSADECDINGDPKKRPLTGGKFALATVGVFALLILIVIAIAAEPFQAFLQQVGAENSEQSAPINNGPVLAAIFLSLVVTAAAFVFWTRLSLMGLGNALQNSWLDWLRQIGTTLVNFLFIGVVVFLAIGLIGGLLLQAVSPAALADLQAG